MAQIVGEQVRQPRGHHRRTRLQNDGDRGSNRTPLLHGVVGRWRGPSALRAGSASRGSSLPKKLKFGGENRNRNRNRAWRERLEVEPITSSGLLRRGMSLTVVWWGRRDEDPAWATWRSKKHYKRKLFISLSVRLCLTPSHTEHTPFCYVVEGVNTYCPAHAWKVVRSIYVRAGVC